jgi:hypothetical protein
MHLDPAVTEVAVEQLASLFADGLPVSELIGKRLVWYNDESCPLIASPITGQLMACATLLCACCEAHPVAVYIGAKNSTEGWYFVFDAFGQILADLRTEEYVCQECLDLSDSSGGPIFQVFPGG